VEVPVERLSTQDASFLYLENELNHMAIAAVAIFEGPPPAQDEIESMVACKLELVPRYRQRLRSVPLDLGRPVWCDDPHFNLRYHVRHSALPAPGSPEQLQALVGRVMSQPLDHSKPLWELWVVEGLEDGGWVLLMKLHHSVADGVAATDLLSVLMDEAADEIHPEPAGWRPAREPTAPELLGDALLERLTSPREAVRTLQNALEAPGRAARKLAEFFDGVGTFRSLANGAVESSLNGPIGPHRSWRWVDSQLADIQKVRSCHGGTVNDVVLAVITRGFRALLKSRGEPVDGLSVRTLVPVSVRPADEHNVYNNRVSAMFAELPVGIDEPVQCLKAISQQMAKLKEHHQAVAGETLSSLSGLAAPVLLAMGTRLFASVDQHLVQTVTTNVPGPRRSLYAAGRRMRSAYLYVPLMGSVRIGIAIFSYAGQLTFAVTGDYDYAPDTQVLCRGIEQGLEELLAST
jgi:WS/DGAT/MGAT family acyltransferase